MKRDPYYQRQNVGQ